MSKRVAIYSRQTSPNSVLLSDLRQAVEDRGDIVVATFADDALVTGRGKYAGWNALVAKLDALDKVVIANAGDLPGRSVNDLLKVLADFRNRGIRLYLHAERIDTDGAGFALLDLISAFRSEKLSAAIKSGQRKAAAAGKRIGRPTIPPRVMTSIRAALSGGAGTRPTARRFAVSPASIVNIRRSMSAELAP
jgi:DNA invertase Pin-like site-specific DNA recombinase